MNKTSDGSAQELDDDGASLLELPPSSWLDDNMANCVMAFGGCIMAIGFGIGYGRAASVAEGSFGGMFGAVNKAAGSGARRAGSKIVWNIIN